MTSQGQITLPVALARRFGLRPGHHFAVTALGEEFWLVPVRVAAICFAPEDQRFSVRWVATLDGTLVVTERHLTARRLHRLVPEGDPMAAAHTQPGMWVPLHGGRP